MFPRPALLAFCLALATPLTLASPASRAAESAGTLLALEAEGHVRRTPDIARIHTGITVQATNMQSAMQQNATEMRKVLAALKAAGIAERDIQTSHFTLSPQYHYSENRPPRVSGFHTSNTVQVTVRELQRLGDILDTLVRAGANELHSLGFAVDNPEAARDEARQQALADARRRADSYARELGLKVRRIVSIDEGNQLATLPVPLAMAARAKGEMMADSSTPVAAGESDIRVRLAVVFELGQ